MSERVVEVTAGVLTCAGRVLACQRPAGGYHPGKWEFPGGKVEAGESLGECMQRELQEELGIDATVGRLLWRTRHQYRGREPIFLSFFHIAQYRGTVTNRAFAALRWVTVAELSTLDFLDGDREFITQLATGAVRLDAAQPPP